MDKLPLFHRPSDLALPSVSAGAISASPPSSPQQQQQHQQQQSTQSAGHQTPPSSNGQENISPIPWPRGDSSSPPPPGPPPSTAAASAFDGILHHLQDQLQVNLLQQSYLLHQNATSIEDKDYSAVPPSRGDKSATKQLEEDQKSIMLQIQWIQQQLALLKHKSRPPIPSLLPRPPPLLRSPPPLPPPPPPPPSFPPPPPPPPPTPTAHPDTASLFEGGRCRWTGCEARCPDLPSFFRHVATEHTLDDKSTAQARVQMQIVSQLETQLQKERERLQAMMAHLGRVRLGARDFMFKLPTPLHATRGLLPSPYFSMKYDRGISGGVVDENATKRLLDAETAEIVQNKEFYRINDVRPPFTYASLIRQAIMDSKEKQLSLNDIYNWFQNTFAYFRHNAATWKNAIRTNLSLHKCFVRFEDDFGSYWTVDDNEFLKRRHLARGRPRKYQLQQQQQQQQQQQHSQQQEQTTEHLESPPLLPPPLSLPKLEQSVLNAKQFEERSEEEEDVIVTDQ